MDKLEAYLDLTPADIARIVLCLLVEEEARKRLAAFREKPPPQPAERLEELAVVGD